MTRTRALLGGVAIATLFILTTASGAGAIYGGGVNIDLPTVPGGPNGPTGSLLPPPNGSTQPSGGGGGGLLPGVGGGGGSLQPGGGLLPVIGGDVGGPPEEILGEGGVREIGAAPRSPGDLVTRGAEQVRSAPVLPVTGGDIAGLVAMAVGAIAAGAVLVARSRRTATASA